MPETLTKPKYLTERDALKSLEASEYGSLDALALHIFTLPEGEKESVLSGPPERAAVILNLPVAALVALRLNPSYRALTSRYERSETFSHRVEREIELQLIEKMKGSDARIPEVVRGLNYIRENIGVVQAPAAAGAGIVINMQQNNYLGDRDAKRLDEPGEPAGSAEVTDAIFRPLRAGDLPPESIRDLGDEDGDLPLFLHDEDRRNG